MLGNVLVLGNSGVGKSTLINAVIGRDAAATGWGTTGTTSELKIYRDKNGELPFQLIDSVGFEPSLFKKKQAIHAVKKWSSESTKENKAPINAIWFCVEGTSSKLFPDTLKSLSSATAMWENVPVIVVITKSYSVPERSKNIDMVNSAFAKQKRYSKNYIKAIPVVAQTYVLNDSAYAEPYGISELIDVTNEVLPEGIKGAETDIYNYKLKRKRILAQGIVGTAVTAGSTIGAIPIVVADAPILSGIEMAELTALSRLYGVSKEENSKELLGHIIEAGMASAVAKGAISGLKLIPGINIAAGVLNAVVAGCFVAAIGEASTYIFEQIYTGRKSAQDIDWVRKVVESELANGFAEKVAGIVKGMTDKTDQKTVTKSIFQAFSMK